MTSDRVSLASFSLKKVPRPLNSCRVSLTPFCLGIVVELIPRRRSRCRRFFSVTRLLIFLMNDGGSRKSRESLSSSFPSRLNYYAPFSRWSRSQGNSTEEEEEEKRRVPLPPPTRGKEGEDSLPRSKHFRSRRWRPPSTQRGNHGGEEGGDA